MHYGKLVAGVLLGLSLAGWGAGAEASTVDSAQAAVLAPGGQAEQRGRRVYQNEGLKLRIPRAYDGLLLTEALHDAEGDLFSVSERASVEAARKAYPGEFRGAGWLFSIGRVSEDRLHELLRGDMSGAELFATDGKGTYYIYYHPTDVRYMRDTPEAMQRDQEQWSKLNAWAWGKVRQNFIKDNGLNAISADNSSVGICLAQILYVPGTKFALAKNDETPRQGVQSLARSYGERLLYGNTFEMINEHKPLKGDKVTLFLPEQKTRLEFYRDKLGHDYVLEKRPNLKDILYKAVPVEEHAAALPIMEEWLQAEGVDQEAAAWGYTADSFVGTWAEKVAGRGMISIQKGKSKGLYEVTVSWGNSAYETYFWHMTAEPAGHNGLRYKDCRHTIVTFSENGTEKEKLVYEKGSGSFTLNSAHEVMWQDEVGSAGENAVFVKA